MLEVKNLHVSYGMIDAVKGIDFQVNDGEIVSLIGANGAGKTTLFKLIMGLEYPDSGKIITKNGYRIDWLPQVLSDDVDNNTKKGEKPVPKKEKISLKEIDDRLMTIDDFLN